MPIITVMVPSGTEETILTVLRWRIKEALAQTIAVPQSETTVEFPVCLAPERLLVRFESRSVDLLVHGRADFIAEIVGKLVEDAFEMPVECLVVHYNKVETGIYLTK